MLAERSRGLADPHAVASGVFRRELAVFAPDATLAAGLTAMLEASDLKLSRIQPPGLKGSGRATFYSQQNTAFSRKKLQPLLQRFFSGDTED